MAVIARITSDAKLRIIGNLTISLTEFRLDSQGNLFVSEVHNTWPGFESTEIIDTTYQLDDTHIFDTTLETEQFISYLFNLTVLDVPVDKFKITSDKKLYCNEVLENQVL